jgi:non-ribosomal peptide synthetase component F
VLNRELSALYRSFVEGKPAALPPLAIQYADFAIWQRQQFSAQALEPQLVYWQRQLAGLPRSCSLPTVHPRPAIQSFKGTQQSMVFSKRLTDSLKQLGHSEQATLFMTLLAAFKALLYHYTKQDDVFVGTGIADRRRPETVGLIGCFINTLVLRTDLSGNPTFLELLRRVCTVTQDAYEHSDLPFEKLTESLAFDRQPGLPPLVQVIFNLFGSSRSPGQQLPNWSADGLEVKADAAGANQPLFFDLIVSMVDAERGLIASLRYNEALFSGALITEVLHAFNTLLEHVAENPTLQLQDLLR